MKDRILINKDLIPYSFNIVLGDEWFTLLVQHNKRQDLFTVSLYKDKALICTEPLIYDVVLFTDVYQPGSYPAVDISPLDESGETDAITWENMNSTVFLSILDSREAESDE